jgi:hypothetical protein
MYALSSLYLETSSLLNDDKKADGMRDNDTFLSSYRKKSISVRGSAGKPWNRINTRRAHDTSVQERVALAPAVITTTIIATTIIASVVAPIAIPVAVAAVAAVTVAVAAVAAVAMRARARGIMGGG